MDLLSPRNVAYFLVLRWLSSFTHPEQLMIDHDWKGVPGGPSVKFSYTESPARSEAILFDLTLSRHIRSTRAGNILLGVGLQYQRFGQDLVGYEGWYVDSAGDVQTQSGGDLAITYEISYTSARVLAVLVADQLDLVEAALTLDLGTVYVSDRDDHVLRNKLSTAQGAGVTAGTKLEVTLYPVPRAGRVRPWIGLAAEARRNIANISQTQEWYDDEPGDGPVAGTKYVGVPHRVDLFQLLFSLSVGVEVIP
jgi:hypothetical protein